MTPSRSVLHRSPLTRPILAFVCAGLLAATGAAAGAGAGAGATGLTLEQALHGPNRSPQFVARDNIRHPAEELRFFGVTPTSSVIEIWPGFGYWTEILAPYLHDRGKLTLAVDVPNGEPEDEAFYLGPTLAKRLDEDPTNYGRIGYELFGDKHPGLPPNSADMVLTFRNLHNWVRNGDAAELLQSIHRALKPGGVLGIEDHRGNARLPQDPKVRSGYLRQDYAIALVEKAGFRLVATSEMDANPRDTADYPQGVWALPPSLRVPDAERAKYQAIGEADNFVLKFVKVGD